MTDDQDLHMSSLDYQSAVQQHIVEQGTTFQRHYCTVSLCCPSRVSMLTGRAAHNTNVTNISGPYGGYTQFIAEGWNDNYLPVWLQNAGYNTYMSGKLMNGLSTTTYNDPYPGGWTGSDFLLDPNMYIYYNTTMQRNREEPAQYHGAYSTDVVGDKAVRFLEEAMDAGQPFFLGVTPIAPHSETTHTKDRPDPPVPAHRHKDMFPGLKVPRAHNFNPDLPSGGGWIKTLKKLNETVVDYLDHWYRRRIQTLQSVDDMVDKIMVHLAKNRTILENTYIIYTSDNGYHLGQHRLLPGKTCAIEEDINVPFAIRGPGIRRGHTVSHATSHTDLVPTIFELAGIPLQDEFDGVPMLTLGNNSDVRTAGSNEHVNVEFWGMGVIEGKYTPRGWDVAGDFGINNTYKALRIIGEGYNLFYMVWCTNEHELYDMTNDPVQMINLYGRSANISGWDADQLTARVDALLLTLKTCKGRVCTHPWETLHPQGDVHDLRDAMNSTYDEFYTQQQSKVTFSACKMGYLPAYEGALAPIPYGGTQNSSWHTPAPVARGFRAPQEHTWIGT
ncbi:arylsulfatase precursor [Xylariales sp. PMI_506]|nr:arylsulfatase precursor [Xylariales sp. PMI_506]